MSLFQFLRILWAHRLLTLGITVGSVVGAFVVLLLVPPSYTASSRVMLNTMKPDPVTGEVISTRESRTYIATQSELIKDYGVAGKAVENLGWLSDPDLNREYRAAKPPVEFWRWVAQRVMARTDVSVVPLTNILEISYRAETPAQAKAMADALRDAYVDSVLETRRREANRDADWYAQQADKAKALLTQADDAKTAYEKANGIVMQADNSDVDSARLRALAGQGAMGAVAPPPVAQASATDMQLAAIDAQIAQASQSLGPNHPQMIELKSRRNLIANLAAQEHQRMQSAASQMAAAAAVNASAVDRAVAQQTSRVIAKREKIERLQQLQAEVNIRRDQYYKAMARSAELRQEASVADTGLTPMGIALLPQKPSFPNKPLIMGGALGLGLAMGLALSVLVELFGRRVRSADDLLGSFDVPMLAVVRTRPRTPFALPRLPTPGQRRLPNRKVANA